MSYPCPDGHSSESGDYCDVCGTPIAPPPASAAATPPPSAAAPSPVGTPPRQPVPATTASELDLDAAAPAAVPERSCPHCGGQNAADVLFCEDCGYDRKSVV